MSHRDHGNGVIEFLEVGTIGSAQDFLDQVLGIPGQTYILAKEHLSEDFFKLSSGVAGEILQKASNYRKKIGIVGDFSEVASKSLRDFIYESNRTRQVVFVDSLERALELLG